MKAHYECYKCGNEWSENSDNNVCSCPFCGSSNIECINEKYLDLSLNASNIKKLSKICYNLKFEDFKKIFLYALNMINADEWYLTEKFEAFKQEGLDWTCRLDDITAERFFNKLLERI